MRYDATLASRFEVKPHDWETLINQNYLLTKYKGGIGGKIGWTVSSEATYIGLARRDGVTLIVTVLHCTSLQEITSAERLLNWGFAMNGSVKPVGTLVPPLATATAAHPARAASGPRAVALSAAGARVRAPAPLATRWQPAASSPPASASAAWPGRAAASTRLAPGPRGLAGARAESGD